MTTLSLLDQLEEKFPVCRQVNIEGMTVWVWRLDIEEVLRIASLSSGAQGNSGLIDVGIECCVAGVGDESGPGAFNSERGRRWLRLHPNAVLELSKAVQDFNELSGPSEDRKKKSESPPSSEDYSTCVEILESSIQDDSSPN